MKVELHGKWYAPEIVPRGTFCEDCNVGGVDTLLCNICDAVESSLEDETRECMMVEVPNES